MDKVSTAIHNQILAKSLDFNTAVIDALDALVMVIDRLGNVTNFNKACEVLSGYSREEVCGKLNWPKLIPKMEIEVVQSRLDGIWYTGQPNRGESHWITRSGSIHLTQWYYTGLTDATGAITHIVATGTDITTQRRTQEALHNAEAKYRSLVEQIPAITYIAALDDSCTAFYVSPQIERIVGYTPSEWVSNPGIWVERIHPDDRDTVVLKLQQCRLSNHIFHCEYRLIAKDGHEVWVLDESVMVEDSITRLCYVQGVMSEITERKKSEETFRIHTSALNSASDMIVITDKCGMIEYVNPAFEIETGYTQIEVLGKKTSILKSGKQPPELYARLWATILSGATWHEEMTNKRKDGSLIVEDVSITPVNGSNGEIEHFVTIKRNITEKKLYEERLSHLAHHDSLTSLPNRLLFGDRLSHRLIRARRENTILAVMFLDLDKFKLVNDTLGHKVGDMLLREVAQRFSSAMRDADTFARTGGDEFMVILTDIHEPQEAVVVGHRILDSLNEPFVIEGNELYIGTSIGISVYPKDGADVETLVRNADTAMYHAKELGRSRCHLYDKSMNAAAVERITLENGLRKALERDEFRLYYQPKVDIFSGSIIGAEALIRWQHPNLGLVSPLQFVGPAEETGLIVPISAWVMKTACTQNRIWQDMGYAPIDMAVNISAKQFHLECIYDTVQRILEETNLAAQYLSLELTESALMHDPQTVVETLTKLKTIGVQTSIDDFGTGYSSLSYLKRLPINTIKVDRSFIKDITTSKDSAAIAAAVVTMAHSLNLKVIAEGVETIEQLHLLKQMNCDEMQGYLISPPVPADEFTEILQRSSGLPRKAA